MKSHHFLNCFLVIQLVSCHSGPFTEQTNFRDSSYPHPRIVLLGSTGTGKSSVGNVLLGRRHDAMPSQFGQSRCFHAGIGNDAITSDVCADQGPWMGDGINVTVVDTPGFGDKDFQKDGDSSENLINFLKDEVKYVDAFVIFFNGKKARFTWSMLSMIKQFENMFGPAFWDNVIFEVTFWPYDDDNIRLRDIKEPKETEESFTEGRNRKFKEVFKSLREKNQNIDSVFIHPLYNEENQREKEEFMKNTEKLFKFASSTKPFACKDIKFVLGDVEKFQKDKIKLQNEKKDLRTRIESLEEDLDDKLKKRTTKFVGMSSGEAGGLGVGMLFLGLLLGAGITFYVIGGSREEENPSEIKTHHTYSQENSMQSRLDQVDGSVL